MELAVFGQESVQQRSAVSIILLKVFYFSWRTDVPAATTLLKPDNAGIVMSASGDPNTDQLPKESSDHSLLRRLRDGNADAATALYLRYAERLNALARSQISPQLAKRIESEEIVQSVFGSFFRGAQDGFYDVPVGEELWKLFLVIALNKIRRKGAFHLAAKRDSRITKSGEFIDQDSSVTSKDDEQALKLLELTIEESMSEMPEHYRKIIALRVEGYEVEQIANQTQRSKRTVERVLQEVRSKLSHLLTEDCNGRIGHLRKRTRRLYRCF